MKRRLVLYFLFLFTVFSLLFLAIACTSCNRSFNQSTPPAPVSYPISNERKLPIYSVQTEKPQIAITFDSAWGVEDLDAVLSSLKEASAPACFFVTGEWIEKYPDAIKKILSSGHEIGNHGDNHKHMNQLSMEECKKEIAGCHAKLKKLTGNDMSFFRAPYGEYNNTVVEAATQSGYQTIQWSVDSLDWKNYGTANLINTVIHHKDLENGAILLLHNGTTYTAEALPSLLQALKEKGYDFVSLKRLILKDQYSIDHTGKQIPAKAQTRTTLIPFYFSLLNMPYKR